MLTKRRAEYLSQLKKKMQDEMAEEMRDLLGNGYVDDYYVQNADGFVRIAEYYAAKVSASARRAK